MLLHFGVQPYLVFDGDYLPSKAHTEKERAARRKESRRLGLELLGMGRTAQAHLELQKAVDVTPSMARELIEELKLLDVAYVVAPYEADSQLAYLEKRGVIAGVLSEDSDLLVFGVKCLLTKLDQYGECVMINRADFTACRDISLVGWTDKEFRIMAMLSGCDYLPGIDKMGLKTAHRLVRKHKVIERIVRTVQFDGKMKVPAGFLEAFTKADRTFLYQWVFCPEAQSLVNLNTVPAEIDLESMPYIGKQIHPEIAARVAIGDLDPNTKEPLKAPERPLQHSLSRMSSIQTADEKQRKPITEFFKPKRTPLAELDPNSFTPSPSQHQLLQNQRGNVWSASQVETARQGALHRVASATDAPSSAPQATRRTVSEQGPDRQRTSPKRQRLCSDSMLAAAMEGEVGLQTATSRFFSKQIAEPSPSIRKTSKKKKEDFELWSDDSTAEAMAAVTAAEEVFTAMKQTPSPKKRRKLKVFADPGAETSLRSKGDEDPDGTSQETTTTAAASVSQQAADEETPLTSFETEEIQMKQTVFSKGLTREFESFKSKYSFCATSPRKGTPRTESAPLMKKSPLQETQPNKRHVESARSGCLMEQQDRKVDLTNTNITEVPASSPPPTADEVEIDDEEWLALEHQQVSSAPKRTEVCGSEDFLVPNSPESVQSEKEDDGHLKPKIDFGRFAFGG